MERLIAIPRFPGGGVLALALALRAASSPTADLSFIVLAFYALRGRFAALQALSLTWLFLMLNPAAVPDAGYAAMFRYGVLFACLFTAITTSKAQSGGDAALRLVLLLSVPMFIHAAAASVLPDVSLLKTLAWTLSLVTLIACFGGLSPEKQDAFERFLLFLLLGTMAASLPFLVVGPGFAMNGTGFQGIFGHPQTMGITAALTGAWVTLRALALRRAGWDFLLAMGLCVGFVFLSEARTGLLAMVLGLTLAIMTGNLLSGRSFQALMPGFRNPKLQVALLLAITIIPLSYVFSSHQMVDFFQKRSASQSISEAYIESRGGLIDSMIANIEQFPLTGIGLGIGSYPELMIITRDPIFSLPVSALTEKGVLPIAIVEEMGFLVGGIVLLWIGATVIRAARTGVQQLGLVLVFLLINMGEATLFSPGGAGQLGLILIAISIAKSSRIQQAGWRLPSQIAPHDVRPPQGYRTTLPRSLQQ